MRTKSLKSRKRFYLRAPGSVCYDGTGLTYPYRVPVDWTSALESCGIRDAWWAPEYERRNLPLVLAFKATPEQAKKLGTFPAIRGVLIVREHWNEKEAR